MGIRIHVLVVAVMLSIAGTIVAAPAQRPTPAPAPASAPAAPISPVAPSAAAAVPGDLPTVEQLNAQLAEGKHQDVLKHVAKLLGLRGESAKAYDRYDLLCLRGEAALRGKASSMAIEAFGQASRATTDPEKQAVARATEVLIRRAKPLGYVPRTAPQLAPQEKIDAAAGGAASAGGAARAQAAQPIPLIEEADRKRAFAALFADEFATVEPKVKAATKSNGLPPVIDAIKSIGDLRAIEIAATGSSTRTKGIAADLGAHAHQLISGALRPMSARVEECWSSASRATVTETSTGERYRAPGMWGLTSTEQNDLKAVIATCEKVQPVAGELAEVTERSELIADAQMAQKLHARATEVLTYDYPNSGRYNKTPQKTQGTGRGTR
jgi:hypothetical protein